MAGADPNISETISTYLKTARTPLPDWEPVWKSAKSSGKKTSKP
jgi:hypothetical protein